MKTQLEEIKGQLESTLDGFKDAYENYGYDLANERYYVETALKKVNLLLLHNVSVSFLYDFVNEFTDIEIPKEAIKETLDNLNER